MTLDVQGALEALRSGEEAVRRATVDHLGRSGVKEAIAPLLTAVGDDSWPVRQAATEQLTGFDRDALLPALEAALRNNEDAALRNAAMEIYVKMGAAALPPLLELIEDADQEIRNFAAVMLGTLRDERGVSALIRALQDQDVNVRHAAAASLGQIGSREAVSPLIEALRTEPWLQYPAITALGEIGDSRATPALLELLSDEMLRGPVLEALGRVAGREALRHLIPGLYAADPVLRNLAIKAVVSIEQRATAEGESLDPDVQAALRRGDLVEHLLHTLDDDDHTIRRTAVITLGWLKEPRAEPALIGLLRQAAL